MPERREVEFSNGERWEKEQRLHELEEQRALNSEVKAKLRSREYSVDQALAALAERAVKPPEVPQPPPEIPPPPEQAKRPAPFQRGAERLRQKFEQSVLKLIPRTGRRRIEQVNQLIERAKSFGSEKVFRFLERFRYLRGKGELPGFMREARESPIQKAKPEAEVSEEPKEQDLTKLTTEDARDKSFGRFDSMKAYVEDLAERKPENLGRIDKVYDLLLKTRSTKFDKWKELASFGLSAAALVTLLVTLPLGGSALLRTARMAFGSLNYSTIGFRMGSEWGLGGRLREAQEKYQALKDWKAGEFPAELPEETIGEMIALYRAGVRLDRYENNRQGLKFFSKAGEVFQALRQGRVFESGRSLWEAVRDDKKELLKIGGKVLLYSTPLLAAPFSPMLAMGLYAGTTAANMVERIIRYRQLSAKEKVERERQESDTLLKQITELADRYEQNVSDFMRAAFMRRGGELPERMEEVINDNIEKIAKVADEKYLEIQRARGSSGLKVGAILGAISATFYGIINSRAPAEAAKPEGGRPGAPGAAPTLTPGEAPSPGRGEPTTPTTPTTPSAPEAAPEAQPVRPVPGEIPGAAAQPPTTETQPSVMSEEKREWIEFRRNHPLTIESNPHDWQAAQAAHRQLEQLKPGEQLTQKFSWSHNGEQFEVGGITSEGKFFLDGQRFDIIDGHYVKVLVDVSGDGIVDQHDLINGRFLEAKIDINTGITADGMIAAWDKDIVFGKSHEGIRLVASNRARLDELGVSIGRDAAGQLHVTHESTGGKPGLDPDSFKAYLAGTEVARDKLSKPVFEYEWRFDHYVVHKGAADPYLDLAHQRAFLDPANYRLDETGHTHYTGAPTEQALADRLREAASSNPSFKEAFERGQVSKGLLESMLGEQPAAPQQEELAILTADKPTLELSAGQKSRVLETLKQFLPGYTGERKQLIETILAHPDRQLTLERHADATIWLRPKDSAPLRLDDLAGLQPLVDRLTAK